MLLFLDENNRFDTAEKIDQIISVEIPDVNDEPELHAIVTRNMMHGPCVQFNEASPCMIQDAFGNNSLCSKNFQRTINHPPSRETTVTRHIEDEMMAAHMWFV